MGRRLAERLMKDFAREADAWGGLDPDVVETAGLAHDLGHPPFGHDGEQVICQSVQKEDAEGFEGNAQSFRILTRLAAHTDNQADPDDRGRFGDAGLNLTRATLNAILKYPWLRAKSGEHHRKWGAYRADTDRLLWARAGWPGEHPSLKAELMNWADDVTYAVHDLEDFYRAGLILIPIHRLLHRTEQDRFIDAATTRKPRLTQTGSSLEKAVGAVFGPMRLFDTPYDGGRGQRTLMNSATSSLITQFITGNAIRICDPSEERIVVIDPEVRLQGRFAPRGHAILCHRSSPAGERS